MDVLIKINEFIDAEYRKVDVDVFILAILAISFVFIVFNLTYLWVIFALGVCALRGSWLYYKKTRPKVL